MKNQNITIVFLAVILVAGATTIASPILIDDASATGDKYSDAMTTKKNTIQNTLMTVMITTKNRFKIL